jgi:hypothetical protein
MQDPQKLAQHNATVQAEQLAGMWPVVSARLVGLNIACRLRSDEKEDTR